MTKERRLAIEMWTEIAKRLGDNSLNIGRFKIDFTKDHNLHWKENCWFCQYVRNDYRWELESRSDIGDEVEGCSRCPLFKNSYEKLYEDECGCSCKNDTIFCRVVYGDREYQQEAAWKIVELLGGEVPEQYRR